MGILWRLSLAQWVCSGLLQFRCHPLPALIAIKLRLLFAVSVRLAVEVANNFPSFLSRWSCLREFLPEDLSELALRTGAVRRFRKIRNGEDLLLAALLYALPGDTFESASRALSSTVGVSLSAPGLFLRLEGCEGFLKEVFSHLLKHARCEGAYLAGRRVVIVDATMLAGPGADRTSQVLHVRYDLASGLPEQVEITDCRGGETFNRHTFEPGSLVIADRGYAHPKGILGLLESGSSMLVRFEFESMSLFTPDGQRIKPASAKDWMKNQDRAEFEVRLKDWTGPLRALGCRNDKGELVWLLTDVAEEGLSLREARGIYGVRWQIELFFKRLKSLLDLDELPTRDGPSARPWIWAKLILAALAVLSTDERFSPWGCPA